MADSSLPDSSMNDIIVKLAEDRAASLPEDRWLSVSKPDKSYVFESVPEGEEVLVRMIGLMKYTLKFRAKNMKVKGNPLEVFQVTGDSPAGIHEAYHLQFKKSFRILCLFF
nr:hypothetical protein Iba_chr13bCG0160 [Ipomoea batatas]